MADQGTAVWNQVATLADVNGYEGDTALQAAVQNLATPVDTSLFRQHGQWAGASASRLLADEANHHAPQHQAWDALGRRQDAVVFHPSWHALMTQGFAYGLHGSRDANQPIPNTIRAVHFMLHGQLEAGSLCPLTMTNAARTLLCDDSRFAAFVTRMQSRRYDSRDVFWSEKTGVMVGMGLTEKQGGTDLRLCQTRAVPVATPEHAILSATESQHYALTGHKWFYSSPTSDAHLVLAQEQPLAELSCFFVPRWLAPGQRNAIRINRLKDKLGNRSNASAEVEFDGALALRVGAPGRGIALLMTMAGLTRLDCVMGSTALMRQGVVQALYYARHRQVMGRLLVDQPLMREVLADLALESEAATTLAVHLAHAFDHDNAQARAWQRVLTPAAKYWICERTVVCVAEAMECLGGNGYIEDGPLARLYREAPVNAIWEGSGNVMCLDVLRALARQPELGQALWDSLSPHCQDHAEMRRALQALSEAAQGEMPSLQRQARAFSRQLVCLVQAALLRQTAPAAVVDTFIQTRLVRPGLNPEADAILHDNADILLQRAWSCL